MNDEVKFDRVYVFGDSYSDTGAGYVDGNGPTAVFYMAENMGITLYHAHDPAGSGGSLNFAVSGAQTGRGDGTTIGDALLGYGMMNQVEDFVGRVKAKEIAFTPETTLFFIAGGLNDGSLETDTTLSNLRAEMKMLKSVGAVHFALALLPETLSPGFNALGIRLNPAYEELAPALVDELKIDLRLSHWGHFFDEVYTNPQAYGILNTQDQCAGRAIFNEDTTPCDSPDTHFFYHGGHPSTAVHRMVGEKLFGEVAAWREGA